MAKPETADELIDWLAVDDLLRTAICEGAKLPLPVGEKAATLGPVATAREMIAATDAKAGSPEIPE